MRYRLQRHDGTDCSATMVPITVLRMVPIQRYRQTRYQASWFLASFYVLFCGHIPLPVENMLLPKNCPKNPSKVSASPQTLCSWAFRLKDFFQAERFRGINSSARMPMNKAFAERLKPLKEKISVLLCVYKETGETTGRINKSS